MPKMNRQGFGQGDSGGGMIFDKLWLFHEETRRSLLHFVNQSSSFYQGWSSQEGGCFLASLVVWSEEATSEAREKEKGGWVYAYGLRF